jgi:septal ring factor EnvC (AmiA/AmiB activator)
VGQDAVVVADIRVILRESQNDSHNFLKGTFAIMSVKALEERPETETSAKDFQSLEDKIYRTIELLKAAREAKTHAERDVSRLRQQLKDQDQETHQMRAELVTLRKEREEVRTRVEKMLKQIDALTSAESQA